MNPELEAANDTPELTFKDVVISFGLFIWIMAGALILFRYPDMVSKAMVYHNKTIDIKGIPYKCFSPKMRQVKVPTSDGGQCTWECRDKQGELEWTH